MCEPSASGKPIELAGVLTVEDLKIAHRLATPRYWPKVFFAFTLIFAIAAVFFAIGVSSRPYSRDASNRILLTVCVVGPLIFVGIYIFNRPRLNRLARDEVGIFTRTRTAIDEMAIRTFTEHTKSEVGWDYFTGFRSNDDIAVLFFGKGRQYIVIARQKLKNDENWERLLTLIGDKLPQR